MPHQASVARLYARIRARYAQKALLYAVRVRVCVRACGVFPDATRALHNTV